MSSRHELRNTDDVKNYDLLNTSSSNESPEEYSLNKEEDSNAINEQDERQDITATVEEKKPAPSKTYQQLFIGIISLVGVILLLIISYLMLKSRTFHYNPYKIDVLSIRRFPHLINGVLIADQDYDASAHLLGIQSLFSKLPEDNPLHNMRNKFRKIIVDDQNQFNNQLNFTFSQTTLRVSHLVIKPMDDQRFSPPLETVNDPGDNDLQRLDSVGFSLHNQDGKGPFGFSFSDPAIEGNSFIEMRDCSFVFMRQFIHMEFKLPSQRLYGLGERIKEFGLKPGAYNMWSNSHNNQYDDGSGMKAGPGVHPFLLVQSGKRSDDYFGIFFRSSNAMTATIAFNSDGTTTFSMMQIGGQIEMYLFIHGSARDVVAKYQEFMGSRARMPPFWALGWMQSNSQRWSNQSAVEESIHEHFSQGFPLDAIFIDQKYYMDSNDQFQINKSAFSNLTHLVNIAHSHHIKVVPELENAIYVNNKNTSHYYQGAQIGAYLKSGLFEDQNHTKYLLNIVNGKPASFIDWFTYDAGYYLWSECLNSIYQAVPFDGLQIEQSELRVQMNGEINPNDLENFTIGSVPKNNDHSSLRNHLPFMPDFNIDTLNEQSITMNATSVGLKTEYYHIHNLNGVMMAKETFQYIRYSSPIWQQRVFISTSSSTYTSSGYFTSYFNTNYKADYDSMKLSIAGIMSMNMFGIPHSGIGICGKGDESQFDDKLCTQWIQLSTFYPLARLDGLMPYEMKEPYKSIVKRAILDRYQFLRQLYTCLYEVHQHGGTCIEPIFFHYPNEEILNEDTETTFIASGVLKVTPNLMSSDQTQLNTYFPQANGEWVNIINLADSFDGGKYSSLNIQGPSVNVHLMPGKILIFQNNSDGMIKNVSALLTHPLSILINPDNSGYAQGTLFLDKGEMNFEFDQNQYEYYTFHYSRRALQIQLIEGTRGHQFQKVENIKILHQMKPLVKLQGCYLSIQHLEAVALKVEYNENERAVVISSLDNGLILNEMHSIYWSEEGDIDVCSETQFQYYISNGKIPDLKNKSESRFALSHVLDILPDIQVTLRVLDSDMINIKWNYKVSQNSKRQYEVPEDYISAPQVSNSADLSKYIQIDNNPFKLKVFTTNEGKPTKIFAIEEVIYEDYLNWISVKAFTEQNDRFTGIFGLGERASLNFFLQDGVYSMWNKDSQSPLEKGTLPAANMYGTHPYFMYKHKPNMWVGVFYKLAAAQDWWIKNDQSQGIVNIKTVAVGGVLDLFIFTGQTPEKVIDKYYQLVGKPVLIPQWALGWHQCRFGYKNLQAVEKVVESYRKHELPLDVMWADIDYMKNYRNFEYDDQVNFKGLHQFVEKLHELGMKFVPIIDAGIAMRHKSMDNYAAYQEGIAQDIFMKTKSGENFIGQVWPNDAVYPDYFNQNAKKWWYNNLNKFQSTINFDGLWLDMNEVSNFCGGFCYQYQQPKVSVKSDLLYVPTGRNLETIAMPLDVYHKDGNLSFDTHSLYAIQQVMLTHQWFESQDQRTFILTRSSFAGIGKFGSKWLGDNFSKEQYMKASVLGIMQMSMFGVPLTGSDICGFMDDANEDLCVKWHFVGAFYPFSRNHNSAGKDQEPYTFSNSSIKLMREAIQLKYSLIRYYYTSLHDISNKGSGTLYKPLFFEFPEDINCVQNISNNIMLGSALKLSINSERVNQYLTDYYFPAGLWCLFKGKGTNETCIYSQSGIVKRYPSHADNFQLHIREGHIVPTQNTASISFNTSKDLQNKPIELHILGERLNPDSDQWEANGRYVNDDGETPLKLLKGRINKYHFTSSYDGNSIITVNISMEESAVKAKPRSRDAESTCLSVNKNDYLSGIVLYNAKGYEMVNNFTVKILENVSVIYEGTAKFNKDRETIDLIIEPEHEICMPIVSTIIFTKMDQ